ncbi:MAG: hypothetical protein IJP01_01915, partial [Oscillospiraceae bacterium]|nr:hypothetical protein [Oscillospiraceae bacterium]
HMLGDYEALCREAQLRGKFEAYKNYTQKYPSFFGGVLKYLYCQPLENLRPIIEAADFTALLQAAQRNYESGMVEYAERSIANYLQQMSADFPFTLLIGLELANIGGCSLPTEGDEPFLYIGIDRALSRQWLDIFAPHELLHLVRNRRTKPACPETVLSRAVEEGLASYASLWVHHLPWNAANIARTLNVSEAQAQNLLRSTDMLLQRLRSDGGKPISPETMQAYFTDFMPETELPVIGYYLGLHLTHEAVARGADFSQLIILPAEELAAAWL